MARRYGDPTAEQAGRLTINPLKHLDPLGTFMLFFGPFGWAKPVPVNPMNLRDPFKDMMPIAAAGPAMNLLLACVSAGFIRLGMWFVSSAGVSGDPGLFWILYFIVMYFSLRINIGLAVFNLIPMYPLDGSRILMGIIPMDKSIKMMQYGQVFVIVFLVLVLTNNLGFILVPINCIQRMITSFFGIPNLLN